MKLTAPRIQPGNSSTPGMSFTRTLEKFSRALALGAFAVLGMLGAAGATALCASTVQAQEHVVYSAQRGLWMGGNTPVPPMDYYLTLGRNHGLLPGSKVEVMRRQATYDVVNKKLHKDLTYVIARLRVIHSETGASIARLESMTPEAERPALTPNGVAIGDLVRVVR